MTVDGIFSRYSIVILLFALCSSHAPAKKQPALIFKWVSQNGVVHISDRLDDVPEPYRSLYAKKIAKLKEQKKTTKHQPCTEEQNEGGLCTPPTKVKEGKRSPRRYHRKKTRPSLMDKIEADKKKWQNLVKHWQTHLFSRMQAYEKTKEKRDNIKRNPRLAVLPKNRQLIQKHEKKMALLLEQINKARHMLKVELPKKARQQNIPPKWLQ